MFFFIVQFPDQWIIINYELSFTLVGSGTAGSVLAARLSEDADVEVAVLEAGPEETVYPNHNVPLEFFTLQNTEADWAYRTVTQKNACLGMEEQVMTIVK